jgi:hypothetical protein
VQRVGDDHGVRHGVVAVHDHEVPGRRPPDRVVPRPPVLEELARAVVEVRGGQTGHDGEPVHEVLTKQVGAQFLEADATTGPEKIDVGAGRGLEGRVLLVRGLFLESVGEPKWLLLEPARIEEPEVVGVERRPVPAL